MTQINPERAGTDRPSTFGSILPDGIVDRPGQHEPVNSRVTLRKWGTEDDYMILHSSDPHGSTQLLPLPPSWERFGIKVCVNAQVPTGLPHDIYASVTVAQFDIDPDTFFIGDSADVKTVAANISMRDSDVFVADYYDENDDYYELPVAIRTVELLSSCDVRPDSILQLKAEASSTITALGYGILYIILFKVA